ncbi:unnamed protein product [Cladocopium goreaui]|uniref:N(6)-adenine-specific DNA methyltransferase 2 n=1 Tax=Cladocopium goreaui TaxID=2562237 RepID=A0A9P1DVI0_9DINO|nr:unnamed protein product [Cladocopium goreaui]
MVKGACHPNGSNFQRVARLDVVNRVRRLSEVGLLKERPKWLNWCERVPPMENHNLQLQTRTVRSPYPQMVNFLLKKYPDLRFQDCYVDGNDWSAGNDAYRDDHPVMQFVGKQLEIMRMEGTSKKEAFKRTEEHFRERRRNLETEQKLMMAMAVKAGFQPMFCTGRAYLEVEKARLESTHLKKIIGVLRKESAALRPAAGEVQQFRHRVVEEKVFRAFVQEPPTPEADDEALQRFADSLERKQEEKDEQTTSKETPQKAMQQQETIDQEEEKALPEDTTMPDKDEKESSYSLTGRAQSGPKEQERANQVTKMLSKKRQSMEDDEESDEGDGDSEERERKRVAGDVD